MEYIRGVFTRNSCRNSGSVFMYDLNRTDIMGKIFEFILDDSVAEKRKDIYGLIYGGETLIKRLFLGLRFLLKSISSVPSVSNYPIAGKRWILLGTNNHVASLSFLLQDPRYTGVNVFNNKTSLNIEVCQLDVSPGIGINQFYDAFIFCKWFFTSPKSFSRSVFHIFRSLGIYDAYVKIFMTTRPECIIISNDHMPIYRSIAMAARMTNVPCIYIQHASVSQDFPSLIGGFSLLDGRDTFVKYFESGKKSWGTAKLVGIPKYDSFIGKVNYQQGVNKIGLPYNLLVDVLDVVSVVEELGNAFPSKTIVVRPHPADKRRIPGFKAKNIVFSLPQEETSFEFLAKLDCVVSPSSSILLEASLMNVYPICFNLGNNNIGDIYGFVKSGLAASCTNSRDLIAQVSLIAKVRPFVRDKAKYYCSTLGTEFEGKSSEIARQLIDGYLEEFIS